MAADHDYEPGHMDISQHKKTWAGFVKFTELSIVFIGIAMFLLMLFRTHN
ncbi:MAG: aa3-type cytochrome c oxidase subunit IV [Rhizomicrobium sp.]